MYKVALIPPERWIPNALSFVKGERPDVYCIYDHLRELHGIDIIFIDPHAFPLNPFAKMHPVYGGLDPVRTLKVLVRMKSLDAVISVFESSPTLLLLLRQVFKFKLPIGMWDIAPDEKWRIRRIIQNTVVPRIDKIMVLSSSQVSYADKRWGSGTKFSVIWQHVDIDFFSSATPTPFGPILAIGDDHGRDWDTFIDAVAPLDVDVIVKTRKNLSIPAHAKCRITQIKERISFLALRDLYEQCSFVVIPLRQTLNVSGVGSILEAMAMSKAIVANDNIPIMDYLVPGETANIVKVGDVVGLRNAIVNLIENPLEASKLGQRGRERAVTLYSPLVFAERMAVQLRELISSRK